MRSELLRFLLFDVACDIILAVLDWEWIVRFSGTLFTSTSDFVYIEGLGNQVNRHLAHAEFCVRKMSTPGEGKKKEKPEFSSFSGWW